MSEPRSRRKRFDEGAYKGLQDGESEGEGSEGGASKSRSARASAGAASHSGSTVDGGKSRSGKKRRRAAGDDDDDYINNAPDEFAINKAEYSKVEKLLFTFGWGRWRTIKDHSDIALSENNIEHIAR